MHFLNIGNDVLHLQSRWYQEAPSKGAKARLLNVEHCTFNIERRIEFYHLKVVA
jgi:hypothetical protein